jgi:hypothetical protein
MGAHWLTVLRIPPEPLAVVTEEDTLPTYPKHLDADGIEDPGHRWATT